MNKEDLISTILNSRISLKKSEEKNENFLKLK
jgi:hypothetical protein